MAKFCQECGAPLADGAKFCENCGAKALENTPKPQAQGTQKLFCAACGRELSAGMVFCTGCGTPVEGAKTSPQPSSGTTPFHPSAAQPIIPAAESLEGRMKRQMNTASTAYTRGTTQAHAVPAYMSQVKPTKVKQKKGLSLTPLFLVLWAWLIYVGITTIPDNLATIQEEPSAISDNVITAEQEAEYVSIRESIANGTMPVGREYDPEAQQQIYEDELYHSIYVWHDGGESED